MPVTFRVPIPDRHFAERRFGGGGFGATLERVANAFGAAIAGAIVGLPSPLSSATATSIPKD